MGSATPYGVPLPKRLPFKKGELSAKLTEGLSIPPSRLRRATVPQCGIVNPRLRTVLAFSGPVLRGCALRFAPCARHFSPSGLRRSQAHSRLSLPYWGLRTGLRFAGPVFRGCGALRAVLTPSPLRGFDGFGLFRAQRAAFVRPCANACAVFRVCGCPLGMSSTLQPFAASGFAPCSPYGGPKAPLCKGSCQRS